MIKIPEKRAKELICQVSKTIELTREIKRSNAMLFSSVNKLRVISDNFKDVYLNSKSYYRGSDDSMSIIIASNNASSLADAIEDREVVVQDVKYLRDQIIDNAKLFLNDLNLRKGLQEKSKFLSWENGLEKAQSTNSEIASIAMDQAMDDAKSLVQRNRSKYKKLLPKANNSSLLYVVLRLPVIPLMAGVREKDLKRIGIKTDKVGYYNVLNNQIILGINSEAVKGEIKRNKDIKNVEGYATFTKKVLEQKLGTRLVSVGKPVHYLGKRTGFLYFWLMKESQYNKLSQLTSKALSTEWGLAF